MKNYLEMNGNIGQYRGYEVYIVDYTKFKKADAQHDVIYAVRRGNKDTFLLVLNDAIIGYMNAQGDIQRYRIPGDYPYYTPPVKKVEQTKTVNNSDYTKVLSGEPAQIKYSDYTKTVDDFFEGLHELWKEMEV